MILDANPQLASLSGTSLSKAMGHKSLLSNAHDRKHVEIIGLFENASAVQPRFEQLARFKTEHPYAYGATLTGIALAGATVLYAARQIYKRSKRPATKEKKEYVQAQKEKLRAGLIDYRPGPTTGSEMGS